MHDLHPAATKLVVQAALASKRTACVPEVGSRHGSHRHTMRAAGSAASSRANTRTWRQNGPKPDYSTDSEKVKNGQHAKDLE
jgi:hypothetical protein